MDTKELAEWLKIESNMCRDKDIETLRWLALALFYDEDARSKVEKLSTEMRAMICDWREWLP